MMRRNVIGQGMAVLTGVAMLLTTHAAGAADVAVPEGALAPNTNFVMWADLDGFDEQAVSEALSAVTAAAPAAEQERLAAKNQEQLANMAPMFEAAKQLKADGVTSGVMAMSTSAEPGGQTMSQLFLKAKPGSDPKAAVAKTARAVNAWMKENKPSEAIDDAELDEKLESTEYVKIDDEWYAVQVDDEQMAPLPEAASAADPVPFVQAMQAEQGAPVRFAFVMSPQMKQQLQQAAADPNAAMMAGLIQPLQDMQTATGGMWLGGEPKLKVSMNFGQEQSATAFKTSSDGMIQFMGQMMIAQAMQGGQQGGQPDMQKVQQVMPLLLLEKEGPSVTKTLDIDLLKQLADAGIPWWED